MSAPILGIGEAFRGLVDSERQRRDLRDAAAGAAQMFRDVGTPESAQYAEMFMSNPRAAFLMAEQAGGVKQLYAIAQEQASRGRVAKATEGLAGGSPEQLSALAGLAAQEGEFGAAAQLYDLGRPDAAQKPIIREFKVGDRVVTRQFDPASRTWVDLEDAPRFSQGKQRAVFGPDGELIYAENVGVGELKDLRERKASAASALSEGFGALSDVERQPAIVGGGGKIAETAAGMAGQLEARGIVPPGAEQATAGALAGGARSEDISAFRSRMTRFTRALRREIDTGNLSQQDAEALNATTRALDAAASPAQARAAIEQSLTILLKSSIAREAASGGTAEFDPTTEDGADRLFEVMVSSGLSEQEAARFLREKIREISAVKAAAGG